ncbi:Signal transduction histidine kinase [Duganella sp. CF517]|uniref:GAF domain-containing sensor histidine kinase n=1 Tax=Duganella sp. CF517 TaxID=1881038 RepID=UPI0008AD9556|nr:GAF domain-containing sensor histidine kinase [Duganella sp. CF517]SEO04136.1 Signal transduction histidine kinase [Duganella sp. CF517]
MQAKIAADIAVIQSMAVVPTILETVAALTGLRFVCVARVTADSWTTCAVLDKLNFGLNVGDGLDVTTTICEAVRDTRHPVVIDHVAQDERYRDHHTPRLYGFQSYFSIPLFRRDGDYFGTLCGLDPVPNELSTPKVSQTLALFAQLISAQLENERELAETRTALLNEQASAELREQFIAVLGHDLRTPLSSIVTGADVLGMLDMPPQVVKVVERIRRSAMRIAGLVDDVVDFTRGRMGGGIAIELKLEGNLKAAFEQVIAELRGAHPGTEIIADMSLGGPLMVDAGRMAQLLSNLLKNALVHGDARRPVRVHVTQQGGALEIIVANEGPAIPEETLSQLFKPFWRGKPVYGQKGLGLGLFIVSEIAQSHHGELDVISTDDATSFIFRMNEPVHAG